MIKNIAVSSQPEKKKKSFLEGTIYNIDSVVKT